MWWWNIIKETRQASRGMINLNWDEEMVPDSEQEEEDCKKKLRAVYQYLSSLNGVANLNFTGEDAGWWLYKKIKHKSSKDEFSRIAVSIELDIGDIDGLSEDEVCAINEKIKETLGDAISKREARGSFSLSPNKEIKYYSKTKYDDYGFIARVSLDSWEDDMFAFFKFVCRPSNYTNSEEYASSLPSFSSVEDMSGLTHHEMFSDCYNIAKTIMGML